MNKPDYIGAYIQFSLLHDLIIARNYSGGENFVRLYRENLNGLYDIYDTGAVAKLMKIESMLMNKQKSRIDNPRDSLEILNDVNNINCWLANGAKLQKIARYWGER